MTTETKNSKSAKKKSALREWIDAIVFAVIAATIIRGLTIEAFAIPTSSMESSLLVGDHIFVSKLHYGARTPKTPLQIPLTHQKIWGTNIPSYLTWIQLPQFRLPGIFGLESIENNDILVFNHPSELQHPVDLKTFFIKRCIAIPGDNFEVRNKQIYINDAPLEQPENMQTSYYITPKNGTISARAFDGLDISESEYQAVAGGYVANMTQEKAEELKSKVFVEDVKEITHGEDGVGRGSLFPSKDLEWSLDNLGKLYIPKEGDQLEMTEENIALYNHIILNYEDNNAELKEGKIFIDGQAISEYTFKQNYYFMMGDNRHNSLDSRSWGMVPEDHVVGKPVMVWWSIDDGSLTEIFSRIRWNRIFKLI